MSPLTAEQRARIEENRKKALEKRALRARIEANRQKALELRAARMRREQSGKPGTNLTSSQSTLCISTNDDVKSSNSSGHQLKNFKPTILTINHLNNAPNCIPFKATGPKILSGLCHLVSASHFSVNIGYNEVVIDIFKSIASASYDSAKKQWRFHIRDHNSLMRKLAGRKDIVSVSELPKTFLNVLLNPFGDLTGKDEYLSKVDPYLLEKLLPFQRDGLMFGISRHGRCLIADDMGLGKTIQALGIAHYYQDDWPLLVVCPTSVRYQWMEALHTWLPSLPSHTVSVMMSGKDYDRSAKVLITSYNIVSRHSRILQNSFGAIIVDESHFMKTYSSARTKGVIAVLKNCRRVILLSGTPALSRPMELFTQIHAIAPKVFPSFQEYGIRFCGGKKTNLGHWDYSGCSNMEELNIILRETVMIRRLKSDVLTQLPSKIRQMVLLSPKESITNNDFQQFENRLQNKFAHANEKRGTLLCYYASTGTYKIPKILDYVNDQLERKNKFIIFAHHKNVLDAISAAIAKQNVDFIRIDGSTSSLSRKEMCDKFQYIDDCLVALLSITAANAGLTLTAANLVIFAELYWNPGILTQAEDRAHRIGQEDCVLVQYLVSPGTVDDHLWPLIQRKLEILNKAGLSKDSFQSSATSSVKFERDTQLRITDFIDQFVLDDVGPCEFQSSDD